MWPITKQAVEEQSGRNGSLSTELCFPGHLEAGVRLHSALPAAASCLAGRYKESLLMAWYGFHKSPIQDKSHLLKPQG